MPSRRSKLQTKSRTSALTAVNAFQYPGMNTIVIKKDQAAFAVIVRSNAIRGHDTRMNRSPGIGFTDLKKL